MDQNECAQGSENGLDSKLSVAEKSSILDASPKKYELVHSETKFASQTPEKTNLPLITKSEDIEFELLQRHNAIVELFDGLTCSFRLLSLRKKPLTFENIRAQVEVLARRKFSHGHVAQLKYLLPEAIQIDKILVHDKKTLCMKPDMKITLLFDVIDGHHEQSNFIALHQLFASRLVNFFTAHPEACDIPEAMLPEPFNQSKKSAYGDRDSESPELLNQASQTISSEQLLSNSSLEDLANTTESDWPPKLSHLNPSFSRHFSEKVVSEREKTQLLASPVPLSSVESYDLRNQDTETLQAREPSDVCSKSDFGTNLDPNCEPEEASLDMHSKPTSMPSLPALPVCPHISINTKTHQSPLSKHMLPTDFTVIETPAQSTPKKVVASGDDNHKGRTSQKQASSSKATKRSLDFSFLKDDELERGEVLPSNSQILDASSALLQKAEDGLNCAADEHRMSQLNLMHQQISMDLPGLVSLIHQLFQSISYSPITKEELVYKIIINNFDFVEKSQVEEQIEILEKLVPDWICRKLTPSGDALYSIKKMSDLNSLKSRLAAVDNP